MRQLLDFWATIYRNARALGAALAIWACVAVAWGMKCQAERDPRLGCYQETGTVIEILGSTSSGSVGTELKMRQSTIMLADSTLIELVLSTPLPAVGDRIPLRMEKYQSGKRVYTFDLQEWKMTGPQ